MDDQTKNRLHKIIDDLQSGQDFILITATNGMKAIYSDDPHMHLIAAIVDDNKGRWLSLLAELLDAHCGHCLLGDLTDTLTSIHHTADLASGLGKTVQRMLATVKSTKEKPLAIVPFSPLRCAVAIMEETANNNPHKGADFEGEPPFEPGDEHSEIARAWKTLQENLNHCTHGGVLHESLQRQAQNMTNSLFGELSDEQSVLAREFERTLGRRLGGLLDMSKVEEGEVTTYVLRIADEVEDAAHLIANDMGFLGDIENIMIRYARLNQAATGDGNE